MFLGYPMRERGPCFLHLVNTIDELGGGLPALFPGLVSRQLHFIPDLLLLFVRLLEKVSSIPSVDKPQIFGSCAWLILLRRLPRAGRLSILSLLADQVNGSK